MIGLYIGFISLKEYLNSKSYPVVTVEVDNYLL